jgi:hypothetical protein
MELGFFVLGVAKRRTWVAVSHLPYKDLAVLMGYGFDRRQISRAILA